MPFLDSVKKRASEQGMHYAEYKYEPVGNVSDKIIKASKELGYKFKDCSYGVIVGPVLNDDNMLIRLFVSPYPEDLMMVTLIMDRIK